MDTLLPSGQEQPVVSIYSFSQLNQQVGAWFGELVGNGEQTYFPFDKGEFVGHLITWHQLLEFAWETLDRTEVFTSEVVGFMPGDLGENVHIVYDAVEAMLQGIISGNMIAFMNGMLTVAEHIKDSNLRADTMLAADSLNTKLAAQVERTKHFFKGISVVFTFLTGNDSQNVGRLFREITHEHRNQILSATAGHNEEDLRN